ncbi:MAG TPA: PFL family protein [Candidatus Xenobia bacterium]|jgi:hypothetical protein
MWLTGEEILETLRMIEAEHLDIRTVTLGISLSDCASESIDRVCDNVRRKLGFYGQKLGTVVEQVSSEFGVPIVNRRIAVTPIAYVGAPTGATSYVPIARALDAAAEDLGVDFIGGFSALAGKDFQECSRVLVASLPEALATTKRVCGSVEVASTKSGIHMTAVSAVAQALMAAARLTADRDGLACGKFVVFSNMPQDNPFMAGAVHGIGEAEACINVGISGPGVVRAVLSQMAGADLGACSEAIKRTAFKITRMGSMVGQEVSRRLGLPFGVIDLSLAPTPTPGDSVAEILQMLGLERAGTHGTTAALMLLNDAVKKGGAMAASSVGGLSGAFIPVTEDAAMAEAARLGCMTLDKLEAMTAVCSVGLDMVAVPGDVPWETLAAIIADEMAIGVVNNKTTGVRIIPVPGKKAGDVVDFGGLLGFGPVMAVKPWSSAEFVHRGGRIPAPIQALGN